MLGFDELTKNENDKLFKNLFNHTFNI
jgi:hypothetical protein